MYIYLPLSMTLFVCHLVHPCEVIEGIMSLPVPAVILSTCLIIHFHQETLMTR